MIIKSHDATADYTYCSYHSPSDDKLSLIYSHRPAPTTVCHSHDDRDGRRAASPATRSVGSGVGPSRSAPRLNIGMATKQILSGIGHGIPNRGSREGRRRERGDGPPQSSAMAAAAGGEVVMGNQHPLEQNHVTSSAIGMT